MWKGVLTGCVGQISAPVPAEPPRQLALALVLVAQP